MDEEELIKCIKEVVEQHEEFGFYSNAQYRKSIEEIKRLLKNYGF